jgi:prepilin-type N-terminal cleavage/methylation domain-containing protein
MTNLGAAKRRLLQEQRGYTLVELITVMAILSIVMGGLTTVFARATNAEADMQNRYRAQQSVRLALDKLRREVHCASTATPVSTATSAITLSVPGYCKTIGGSTSTPTSITWCTRNVSTNRYALYRVVGSTCTGGVKWADNLMPTSTATVCDGSLCVFNFLPQSTTTLARLHVDMPANPKPTRSVDTYELIDDIALRNSTRS